MNVENLVKYFETHKGYLKRGVMQIAHKTHSKVSDVIEAKKILKGISPNNAFKKAKMPKILIFDIETSPVKAYVWKMWKENVSIDQITDDWFVLCWSAKWLYSEDVMGARLTAEEILREDDSRIVGKLWELFNEADIVVAHNAKKFDVPRMNSRFLLNGLNPTTPYHIIDTLEVAKKQFGFTSNKLEWLARKFGFPGKLDTDFNLWKKCMEGDEESLSYMLKYNVQDVVVLEEVYLKLRPWIRNHPNVGNWLDLDGPVCSSCGHTELELVEDKYYYTSIGKYNLYRCPECGAISRGRKSQNKNVIVTTSTMRPL